MVKNVFEKVKKATKGKNTFFQEKKIDYKNRFKKVIDEEIKTVFLDREILSIMPEIKNNTSYHILTTGEVTMLEIVEKIVKNHGIKDVYIATLSFDYKTIDKLIKWIDEKTIDKLYFIRCMLYVGERQELYNYAREELERRGQKIIGLNNHAKIVLLGNGIDFIVISGSQNFTNAKLIEQMTIYNNEALFRFYEKWFKITFKEV